MFDEIFKNVTLREYNVKLQSEPGKPTRANIIGFDKYPRRLFIGKQVLDVLEREIENGKYSMRANTLVYMNKKAVLKVRLLSIDRYEKIMQRIMMYKKVYPIHVIVGKEIVFNNKTFKIIYVLMNYIGELVSSITEVDILRFVELCKKNKLYCVDLYARNFCRSADGDFVLVDEENFFEAQDERVYNDMINKLTCLRKKLSNVQEKML